MKHSLIEYNQQKIEEIVGELQDALEKARKTSFRQTGNTNKDKKPEQYKSVPWWSHNLTMLRKKVERSQKEVSNDEREYKPKRTNERTIQDS